VADLDDELAALEQPAIPCRSCGHPYDAHTFGPEAGSCTARIGGWSTPAAGIPCMCPGFRWVTVPGEPGHEPVGGYG
jgi:hypothetical protein